MVRASALSTDVADPAMARAFAETSGFVGLTVDMVNTHEATTVEMQMQITDCFMYNFDARPVSESGIELNVFYCVLEIFFE